MTQSVMTQRSERLIDRQSMEYVVSPENAHSQILPGLRSLSDGQRFLFRCKEMGVLIGILPMFLNFAISIEIAFRPSGGRL